jgi:RNA polymerase sigma-70 factor (ECF subfamily)
MIAVRLDPRLNPRIDPSDVIQDTLTEAARKLPEYLRDRPLPFYPWLRQIAWNHLVDLYRFHVGGQKRSVRREIDLSVNLSDESIDGLVRGLAASESTPSQELLRSELKDRVRTALTKLPDKYRDVLVLRHLEQLTVEEVAAVLSIAEGTVKSRLFRGMTFLYDLLDEQSRRED